ncbi:hypothetical protein [Streptomyces jumonjinensis]|uniref:hypothetical protein n=1 Tax=Streptomyces jumonjinensis TaxID=1945 RepID=UPI0037B27455
MSSDQQYPYDPYAQQQPQPSQPQQYQAYDAYDPYAQNQGQYSQGQGQYGQDQGQYGQGQYAEGQAQGPYAQQGYPQQPGHHQDAAQTWEGETWDTTYQPVVPPLPAAAEETAYLPPVTAGHPLPPEAPAGPYTPAPHPAPPAPPAPQAPAAEGYSAPTMGGNTRVTDAQRARAEGRSPIIAPGIQPAALTAVLALLLAAGAAVGPFGLVVPLVLLQAVTAAGWFRLNGMWPARQGIALAFAGGLTADAVLLSVGRENAPLALLGTLGVWVLITLVLQLRSHAGADERMYGLMATVASAALAVIAAGHLAAADDAVVVGAIGVAAAVVVRALPLPGAVSVAAALLAAGFMGFVAGGMTDLPTAGSGLLGLAAGVLALVGLRVASYDYPSRFVHFTAGVALPLTAAAPAVYLIGRVLV